MTSDVEIVLSGEFDEIPFQKNPEYEQKEMEFKENKKKYVKIQKVRQELVNVRNLIKGTNRREIIKFEMMKSDNQVFQRAINKLLEGEELDLSDINKKRKLEQEEEIETQDNSNEHSNEPELEKKMKTEGVASSEEGIRSFSPQNLPQDDEIYYDEGENYPVPLAGALNSDDFDNQNNNQHLSQKTKLNKTRMPSTTKIQEKSSPKRDKKEKEKKSLTKIKSPSSAKKNEPGKFPESLLETERESELNFETALNYVSLATNLNKPVLSVPFIPDIKEETIENRFFETESEKPREFITFEQSYRNDLIGLNYPPISLFSGMFMNLDSPKIGLEEKVGDRIGNNFLE